MTKHNGKGDNKTAKANSKKKTAKVNKEKNS